MKDDESGERRKMGLLIVDDSHEVRTSVQEGLARFGFAIWTSATGTNAIARYRLRQDEIDAVLMDVYMPEWDGPSTLSALRAFTPLLPCCFMSGGTGKYSDADLIGFGAHCVFPKPIEVRAVAETFRDLLDHHSPIDTDTPVPSRGIWDLSDSKKMSSLPSRHH